MLKINNMSTNLDTGNTDNPQEYFRLYAYSSHLLSSAKGYADQLAIQQVYSDYTNPIWAVTYGSSSTSVLSTHLLAARAVPAPTLVGSAGGFQINLIWDATISTAPSTFKAGIMQAAQLLCNSLSNNIILNIGINCSKTGGGAAAGPDNQANLSYSTVRANLQSHAATGDTTFNALPAGASIQGQSQVKVFNAQLKLWGLPVTDATDGSATFNVDIPASHLPGFALHELTHAMGRYDDGPIPDIFDLFRYTSPGHLLFSGSNPSVPAYFSLDGGTTNLADYGTDSDPSDFNGEAGGDAFSEYDSSNASQILSALDLKQMSALGYTLKTKTNNNQSVSAFLSNLTNIGAASFVISDVSTAIAANIDLLEAHVNLIKTINQTDAGVALTITAVQLIADKDVLSFLNAGTYTLNVSGVTAANLDDNVLGNQAQVRSIILGTSLRNISYTEYANANGKLATSGLTVTGVPAANAVIVGADAHVSQLTLADTILTAAQYSAAVATKNTTLGLIINGVSVANQPTVAANKNVTSMTVIDTSTNIVTNLVSLQTNIAKIASISLSDNGAALAINATQSLADHGVLTKILGNYSLTVIGTKGNDSLYDMTNSPTTFTGGAGNDTFYLTGADTITDLGNGADIIKIAAGASVNANLAANWTATTATSNAASTANSATINSNGHNVNVAVATGANGWTLNAKGTGTTSLTGSINNDTINGHVTGGLIINGHGGSDTIALGTHIKADTIYLVANAMETITGFGSLAGTVTDKLNVTAIGNALASITLLDKTSLATKNSPLPANASGLVFSHADNGTSLTASTAAALFANTQTLDKFAISKGTGAELLIETGAGNSTNVIWEIIETAGMFTAIKLTGITVAGNHNVAFASLN